MKIENKEVIEKFKDFISSIDVDDNVAILHDTDMDGMTAAVLVKKGLEEIGIDVKMHLPKRHGERAVTTSFMQILQENDISVLICVDLPLESYESINLLQEMKVLVIDHHPVEKDYSHINNLLVIKPDMLQSTLDPSRICSANIVYSLFSERTNMDAYDWIAALGIMADATYPAEKEFVDAVLKRYNARLKEDIFDTELGKAASYGTYADCVGTDEAYDKLFNALDTASNHKELIEKLKEFAPIAKEVNRIVNAFDKKKEVIKDIRSGLIFYEIKTKHRVNSIVSNIISHKKTPKMTLIVAEQVGDIMKISCRRQDMKLHAGEMMRHCVSGLENSNGGGHMPAAGATVMKKDYETFKKRVIDWCRKNG
ncbi:MAG: DHH family phosphoesterase [Nanoarchaeota archaeon]|nr:DHH family phosphoesterase [Nanoarchaeota archaeon]